MSVIRHDIDTWSRVRRWLEQEIEDHAKAFLNATPDALTMCRIQERVKTLQMVLDFAEPPRIEAEEEDE